MTTLHYHQHFNDNALATVQLIPSPQLTDTLEQFKFTHTNQWLALSHFTAKYNQWQAAPLQSSTWSNLFLLGLGETTTLKPNKIAKLAQTLISALQKDHEQIVISLDRLPSEYHYIFALALGQACYTFDEFKTKKSDAKLNQIHLVAEQSPLDEASMNLVNAIVTGQNTTRDLGNMPANICYPEYMADQAQQLAQRYPDRLKVTVLDEAAMQELGMNAFLAVSKGSERGGRLVLIEYTGEHSEQPIVLVGKGVTFDTGGISLKPAATMDEMKFDMCGAATVMGVMRALCESNLPLRVVGALACAENMPSGKATRPGDIVTTLSGQTVEILNTDAEGRLVLCDTLSYIGRYNPKLVIDMATLTGACVVALGKVLTGLFSPNDALANQLLAAGEHTADRAWRLPVTDDYQELLDSSIADVANIGGPTGGAITAACFLQRFTQDYTWAHLDIAGTAWLSGKQKGATGRPVAMLMQFLANQATHP